MQVITSYMVDDGDWNFGDLILKLCYIMLQFFIFDKV
jgi:hypothetical protein